MSLGPFTASPVVPAKGTPPPPKPLPFPFDTAFMLNPVAIINGASIPLNRFEYATLVTALILQEVLNCGLTAEAENAPGTSYVTPQYTLVFQPPQDPAAPPNSPLPLVQMINCGLLAAEINRLEFSRLNAVWNQLPAYCYALLNEVWTAALAKALGN
jgi:hypothetical protein